MRETPVAIEKIAVLRATRRRPRGRSAAAGGPSRRGREAVKAAIVRRSAARLGLLPLPRAALSMANIHSQKKRILRSERERLENRQYTSAIKTYFRRLEVARQRRATTTAADASTASSSRRSTRPSSAARCTATPARARSPAPRACAPALPRSARRPVVKRGKDAGSVACFCTRATRGRRIAPANGRLGGYLADRAQGERVLVERRERVAAERSRRRRASRARGRRARRAPARSAGGVAARDVGDEALGGARRHAQRRA